LKRCIFRIGHVIPSESVSYQTDSTLRQAEVANMAAVRRPEQPVRSGRLFTGYRLRQFPPTRFSIYHLELQSSRDLDGPLCTWGKEV
jgi:hypothetical protein